MVDIQQLTQQVYQQQKEKFEAEFNQDELAVRQQFEKNIHQLEQDFKEKIIKEENNCQKEWALKQERLAIQQRQKKLAIKQAVIDQYKADLHQAMCNLSAEETFKWIRSVLNQLSDLSDLHLHLAPQTSDKLAGLTGDLPVYIGAELATEDGGFTLVKGQTQYNFLFNQLIAQSSAKIEVKLLNLLGKEG